MEGKGGNGNTTSKKMKIQKNSPWVMNNRPAKGIGTRLWKDDLLTRVPRVGEVMVNKIKKTKKS